VQIISLEKVAKIAAQIPLTQNIKALCAGLRNHLTPEVDK